MEKIKEVIAKMTLEDKIKLCSGKSFWESENMEQYGIPAFFMSDGPHGLRIQKGESDHLGINRSELATCFPTARRRGIPDCCVRWGRRSARKRCTTAWMWSWDPACA